MVCGTPSLTTTIGAEGMTDSTTEWGGFIQDNPEEFADRAAQLYLDNKEWENAQKRGLDLIQKRFTKEQFTEQLTQCFKELNDLEAHRNKSLVSLILQKESHQASRYMSIWIEEKRINGHGGS